jgi:GT2 family glycosyltransferase
MDLNNNTPRFSIVIPTYLNTSGVKALLESIKQHTDLSDCEILVVANGAPPETREIVNMGIPLKMLWFDEPQGFSKAVNAGIKESIGDAVILLNDDCELLTQEHNRWLNLLSEPFSDPQVGITGSHKLFSEDAQHEFIIFFCVMLRRKMLDQIGVLDESFSPFYGEDIDLCIRAERAGWKWVQVPVGEECHLELMPNTEHLPEWKRSKWVGNFPISHEAEVTLGQLPNHVEVVERNRAILRARYGAVDIRRAEQIEGWMGHDEMLWLATQAKTRKVIIEVGSHAGKSTRAFADNTEGVVWAVDSWESEEVLRQFYDNLRDHIKSGKVRPVRMSSKLASKTLQVFADFIFIDANHDYSFIKEDIMNWRPWLAKDGVICGHDYSETFPGVVQAVNELVVPFVPSNTGIWVATDELKITEPLMGFGGFFCTEKQINSLSA